MEQKKTELSILIPVYNTCCVGFVRQLHRQAEALPIAYEIIVADDASTDKPCVEQNSEILTLSNCRYIVNDVNAGAAATRNLLAEESRYGWLLFLDCDMQVVDDHFLEHYVAAPSHPVVNGGLVFGGDAKELQHNLRYLYEQAEAPKHTAAQRSRHPYQAFRSANFLISRPTMLQIRFDERFKRSGYEDVLFGKQLKQSHIPIAHIDTPLLMTDYEDNPAYVSKTERSLHTLHEFRRDLKGFSRLLTFVDGIHLGIVRQCFLLIHKLFGRLMRQNLCGRHPRLSIFKLYKLTYYISINQQ